MSHPVRRSAGPLDIARLRADFPILRESVRGKRLAYLDNAATTQKPESVLEALVGYYRRQNANVHRAVHELSERATTAYEGARDTVARTFNVAREQVVFGRGTTDAINLVAWSFLRPRLCAGDEILVTELEHHSNIVPWQIVAAEVGAKVIATPVNNAGELVWEEFMARLSTRTKMIAVGHVSNALGTINPVQRICAEANERAIPLLIDGAQAAAHLEIDFKALGCDFYAMSSHKAYGPTGFGVLLAKRERLEAMPPHQGGGDMIRTVSFAGSTWNDVPYKFEAGTPDMAGAVGFAAALEYVEGVGRNAIAEHEHTLLDYATATVARIPGLQVVGTAKNKGAILSFTMAGAHPHDLGSVLDMEGVAIRAGHHCAMPLMQRLGLAATARASFALYNDADDVEQLAAALHKARSLFA
ncbi:MAG TPA: SufS family cysteine desulfurase [Steroidobacteraceae bacterium]|nr:SufS family cysteine desulfurase [Steroidobacteraceae bacterium]